MGHMATETTWLVQDKRAGHPSPDQRSEQRKKRNRFKVIYQIKMNTNIIDTVSHGLSYSHVTYDTKEGSEGYLILTFFFPITFIDTTILGLTQVAYMYASLLAKDAKGMLHCAVKKNKKLTHILNRLSCFFFLAHIIHNMI
ncbi:hypothetical protein ACJX0J_013065 [Zea mays]